MIKFLNFKIFALILALVLIFPLETYAFFAEPDTQVHSMPFGVKENYSGAKPASPPAKIRGDTFDSSNPENLLKTGAGLSLEPVPGAGEAVQNNPAVKKPFSFDVISFVMWSIIFLLIVFFAIFVFSLRRLNRKK